MKFTVLPVINEYPKSIKPFRKMYDHPYAAKLAFERSKWVWLRTRLAEAQNWKCCFCGCKMTEFRGMAHSATIEHVIPQTFGGTDDPENLAASCNSCNNNRGTDDAYTFNAAKISSPDSEKSKAKHRLEVKVQNYIKRAKKFAEINFDLNENVKSFEDWFSSLRLCKEGREMFFQGYNT